MSDDNIWGGGGFLAFLIFAIFAFGGNGNFGWGGRGGNCCPGATGAAETNGIMAQLNSIQQENAFDSLNNRFAQTNNAMTQGFAGLNTAIKDAASASALATCQSTQAILAAINSGNQAVMSKIDANEIARLTQENNRLYTDKSNLVQTMGFTSQVNSLQSELAACCCQLKAMVTEVLTKVGTTTTAA